ncbi:uncharacterized protein [Rutidosis leptorrhynchoides]|uniref:uncharacterized protein n=1 Tax=Rutidosis leptorrhynchoides TaxID=125765 RepID=UPI003A9A3442
MSNGHSKWSIKYIVHLDEAMRSFPENWVYPYKLVSIDVWCIDLGEREEDSFMVIDLGGTIMQYKIMSNTLHKLPLNTSTCHAKWNAIGVLNDIVSARDLYDARLSNDLKVAELIQGNKWVWPEDWLIIFPRLQMLQVPFFSANMKDEVVWVTNEGCRTAQAWKDLRESSNTIRWHHLVWFSCSNPKQSLFLWLAIQGKLMTHDRMLRWNANGNYACPLCGTCPDSHSHLFFECVYSKKIWITMKKKLLFRGLSNNLMDIVQTLANYHFKKDIWGVINRFTVAVAAVVYHIWHERNRRIFNKPPRNENDLIKSIKYNIELQLLTLNVKEKKSVKIAAK